MLERLFEAAEVVFDMIDEDLGGALTPKASFQTRATKWINDCFGKSITTDATERNFRFLEEALELVQSTGLTKEQVLTLVDYTFNRPIGVTSQEAGGVLITLSALCSAHKIDMLEAGEADLKSAIEKTEKIRVKWGTKPENIRGRGLVVERQTPSPEGL